MTRAGLFGSMKAYLHQAKTTEFRYPLRINGYMITNLLKKFLYTVILIQNECVQAGFPLFRTDKIPWLFQYFLLFFQYFFNVLFFLTENLIHFTKKCTVHLNITKIPNNIYLNLSQFSSILCGFPWLFPDFSSLFKIPWLFPDWKVPSHFSRFSSPSGNPAKEAYLFNYVVTGWNYSFSLGISKSWDFTMRKMAFP